MNKEGKTKPKIKQFNLVAGFKDDCIMLLDKFVMKKSLAFEEFTNTWKENYFSLVFCGRESLNEAVEFTESAFPIARQFFFPPHSFERRIGGLYLLYSLYFKQPCKYFTKIRLTCSDINMVEGFLADCKEQDLVQPCYVFMKMLFKNAFCFASEIIKMSPDCTNNIPESDFYSKEERDHLLDFRSEHLSQLQDIHNKYLDLQKKVCDNENIQLSDISVLQANYIDTVNQLLGSTEELPDNIGHTTSEESIFGRRSAIKDKAYSSVISSGYHKTVTKESVEKSEEESTGEETDEPAPRKSVKYKMKRNLPEITFDSD